MSIKKKILLIEYLTLCNLFIAFFFRIFNFKIYFLYTHDFFKKKKFFKFLNVLNIEWLNFNDHNLNYIYSLSLVNSIKYSDEVSNHLSNIIWNDNIIKNFHYSKGQLISCVSYEIKQQTDKLFRFYEAANHLKKNSNFVLVYLQKSFFQKDINKKKFNFKNINIINFNFLSNLIFFFLYL